ncbi:MAG: helix-turn-helix domain-containing protein [Rhizobiales bacterium]|nr:helix-turn-helix domain-containing protein [Hyphomicrobiales bacterium]
MSIQAVAWAISQRVGSPTGKALLICLANYANEKGECWPSQTTIAREAELGERATRDWLQKLEAQGLITRTRRNRRDGSRTSDLFQLAIGAKVAVETDQPAKTADRKIQAANPAGRPGTRRRGVRHQVPGNEPSLDPSIESSSLPSKGPAKEPERRKGGFYQFWEEWPEQERPEFRGAAEATFAKLSTEDQQASVIHAAAFRKNAKQLGSVGLMIPYLKMRSFRDFEDGPKLTSEGRFEIKPECKEWQLWIDHMAATVSPNASKRVSAQGFLLTQTRLPPGMENLQQRAGEARPTLV